MESMVDTLDKLVADAEAVDGKMGETGKKYTDMLKTMSAFFGNSMFGNIGELLSKVEEDAEYDEVY
jgi:hypothetical protein